MTTGRPLLRIIAWVPLALILGSLGYLIAHYGGLPDEVPLHFNARGEAGGYGPRQMLFVLPAVMLLLEGLMAWLTGHPELANYPVAVTDDNRERLYELYAGLMLGCRILVAITLSSLAWASVAVARGVLHRLHPWHVAGCVTAMIVVTVLCLVQMLRAR